jgi:hypothetical protein
MCEAIKWLILLAEHSKMQIFIWEKAPIKWLILLAMQEMQICI